MALASKVELTIPVFPGAIGSLGQSATVQPQEVVTLDITKGLSPLLVILKVAVTGFFHKIVPIHALSYQIMLWVVPVLPKSLPLTNLLSV